MKSYDQWCKGNGAEFRQDFHHFQGTFRAETGHLYVHLTFIEIKYTTTARNALISKKCQVLITVEETVENLHLDMHDTCMMHA